jgi:hypothetical protein
MTDQNQMLAVPDPMAVALPTKQQVQDIVTRGTDIATELNKIIEGKNLYKQIGPSKHILVEAWQTCGVFLGYTGRTQELPDADQGAKALAEIVNRDGMVVSTATAACGTEGDGQWVKRPYFQQLSMAQTRALSKAFRNVLSWIVVLAGYNATPAEEMGHDAPKPTPAPQPVAPQCFVHGVPFQRITSKASGATKFAHKDPADPTGWCVLPDEDEEPVSVAPETVVEGSIATPEATWDGLPALLEQEGYVLDQFEIMTGKKVATWKKNGTPYLEVVDIFLTVVQETKANT